MPSCRLAWLICVGLIFVACAAPTATTPQSGAGTTAPGAAAPRRTLVMIARAEPPSLAAKPLVGFSGSLSPPIRLFNATLDYRDENEVAHPYLAQALPQVNTDTWRLFPDGRMETTWKLRPGLTWHDGAALSAEDFVFGWRVYATPELGVARSVPIAEMEDVVAPDASTLVIRWRRPYPEAADMDQHFQALPRHLLEAPFQTLDALGFTNHPFWTTDYIGLGPYRLDRWEAGTFIEAVGFAGHALGAPRIERLKLSFISDANTALANMLSGDAHYIGDYVIWYQEGVTLEREWSARNGGTVLYAPVLMRITHVQLRPEFAMPKALLDVRVRRAFAHAIDAPSAVEALTGGRGLLTATLTSPAVPYYAEVERAALKYPYDARRAQQILEEVGFRRGGDGFYVAPPEFGGERLSTEAWHSAGSDEERENAILVDSLRRAGIDASGKVTPAAMVRDAQARSTTPGLSTGGAGSRRLESFTSELIPRPENRWNGGNRGAWSNPDYDRWYELYSVTLDQSERIRQIAQMERIFTEDVGSIPYLFTIVVTGFTSNLHGPVVRKTPESGIGPQRVHTWEWLS
jgi:peptide/nickel transport system substrate-binding protein